jgi:GYD domain
MPHYISLIRYTQKGVESLKDSPKRVEATKKAFEAAGGKLKAIYWTLGQYDAVAIGEFKDDEAGPRVNLGEPCRATSGARPSELLRRRSSARSSPRCLESATIHFGWQLGTSVPDNANHCYEESSQPLSASKTSSAGDQNGQSARTRVDSARTTVASAVRSGRKNSLISHWQLRPIRSASRGEVATTNVNRFDTGDRSLSKQDPGRVHCLRGSKSEESIRCSHLRNRGD